MTASGGGYSCRVVPGDEMMQAFAYTHIAPAQKMLLTRHWDGFPLRRIDWAKSVKTLSAAQPVTVTAKVKLRNFSENAEFELVAVDLPSWLKILPGKAHIASAGAVKAARKQQRNAGYPLSLTFQADASGKGKAVNLIFKVTVKNPVTGKDGKVKIRTQDTVLPAVRIDGGSL
jgi:hypothetical protein